MKHKAFPRNSKVNWLEKEDENEVADFPKELLRAASTLLTPISHHSQRWDPFLKG
jgi:hypothetical protein